MPLDVPEKMNAMEIYPEVHGMGTLRQSNTPRCAWSDRLFTSLPVSILHSLQTYGYKVIM
jgi:hypothetical protein